jgi:hypothetical protein
MAEQCARPAKFEHLMRIKAVARRLGLQVTGGGTSCSHAFSWLQKSCIQKRFYRGFEQKFADGRTMLTICIIHGTFFPMLRQRS